MSDIDASDRTYETELANLKQRLTDLVNFVCSPEFYATNRMKRDKKVKSFLTPKEKPCQE